MPNPKRKTSKTRRDKRRTHYKATAKQFSVDATTTCHTVLSGTKASCISMVTS
jgi:ribosomal protein L32